MSKLRDLLKADPKDFMKVLRAKPVKAVPENAAAAAPKDVVYKPGAPRINVLPSHIKERYANGALIKKFVKAGAIIAILSVAAWGAGIYLNVMQQGSLNQLDQKATSLQASTKGLQAYKLYADSVQTKRTTLAGVLQDDVDVAKILQILNTYADQNGVTFTTVALTLNPAAGSTSGAAAAGSCVSPDPFNSTSTIGCIAISGASSGRPATNAFFNGVQNTSGFANSFISTVANAAPSTTGGANTAPPSTFSGTVAITSVFYSQKYANLSTPLDQLIKQGTTTNTNAGTAPNNVATTGTVTALETTYPTVFTKTLNPTQVTDLITSTCLLLGAKSLSTAQFTVEVGTIANHASITPTVALAMIKTIATNACPSNLPNVSSLGGK
jgi:hypothetical protein